MPGGAWAASPPATHVTLLAAGILSCSCQTWSLKTNKHSLVSCLCHWSILTNNTRCCDQLTHLWSDPLCLMILGRASPVHLLFFLMELFRQTDMKSLIASVWHVRVHLSLFCALTGSMPFESSIRTGRKWMVVRDMPDMLPVFECVWKTVPLKPQALSLHEY